MNRRQRIAVLVGSLIIALMLLFPPMRGYHPGYGFLFNKRSTYVAEYDLHSPTLIESPNNGWLSWHIDQERLIFQILIAVVLTSGITVALGSKRE